MDLSPKKCIDPVKFIFFDIRVFVSKFWHIFLQKLCFFEILFLGVDRGSIFPPKFTC